MLRLVVFVVRIVDPNKQAAPPELRFVVCGVSTNRSLLRS